MKDGISGHWRCCDWFGADSRLIGRLTGAILVMGVAIRLIQYLGNRSLWTDEAMLAWNVLERTPAELLLPLQYHQATPVLFLLSVDYLTLVFGSGELILRLLPLLSSIASLILLYLTARMLLDQRLVAVAVFLLAFSKPLVYFAQEFKQYSTDAAVSAFLLFLIMRPLDAGRAGSWTLLLPSVLGSVCVFLSHPSIFLLTASAIMLLILKSLRQTPHSWRAILFTCGIWGGSFALNYHFFLRSIYSDAYLSDYWSGVFLPIPTHLAALECHVKTVLEFFSFLGFDHGTQVIPIVLTVVAFFSGIRTKSRPVLIIGLIMILSGMVSMLRTYPICGRLSVYMVPFSILIVARGAETLIARRSNALFCLVSGLLIIPILLSIRTYLVSPIVKEEIRPLLEQVSMRGAPDDCVYVHRSAVHVVRYYRSRYPDLDTRLLFGNPEKSDNSHLEGDFNAMKRHARVWVLFGYSSKGEDRLILSALGVDPIESHHAPGAALYLFRFDPAGASSVWKPSQKKTIHTTLRAP